MKAESTTAASFFEAKYKDERDPWRFASSPYELGRYDATIRALEPGRYRAAFEPGCSVGVLTARLAALCDAVEAIDFSPTAVSSARERCAGLPNVRIACMSLPERLPVEGFDLIVLSEIGYYFKAPEWSQLSSDLITPMLRGSTLLATHWLGTSADHCIGGDEVHAILSQNGALRLEHSDRQESFRIDCWTRV